MPDVETRPRWDQTWLDVADVIARRSRCSRSRVGAVVVDSNGRIVATGYNGPPARMMLGRGECANWCPRAKKKPEHDFVYGDDGVQRCTKCKLAHSHWTGDACDELDPAYNDCYTIHAEGNALLYVDRSRCEGGTIYVSSAMCLNCAKFVANSGLTRVVMRVRPEESYRDPDTVATLLVASHVGVTVVS